MATGIGRETLQISVPPILARSSQSIAAGYLEIPITLSASQVENQPISDGTRFQQEI
jgi:hypothetical protein